MSCVKYITEDSNQQREAVASWSHSDLIFDTDQLNYNGSDVYLEMIWAGFGVFVGLQMMKCVCWSAPPTKLCPSPSRTSWMTTASASFMWGTKVNILQNFWRGFRLNFPPVWCHRSWCSVELEFMKWACLLQKFRKDPYVTTLGGFSKVTNYIFDALRGSEEQHQRPPEEVADLLGEVIPGLEINQQEEPGFEVITRVRAPCRAWSK